MSMEIALSNGGVTIVDDEDYAALSLERWSGAAGGARCHRLGSMHRFIMEAGPGLEVDHINRNPLDNRRANLRLCNHRQNTQNRGYTKRPGAGQYKGANSREGRWGSQITIDGKLCSLGYYTTELEAACAYDMVARAAFGEFAKLNFPSGRDWILPVPKLNASGQAAYDRCLARVERRA